MDTSKKIKLGIIGLGSRGDTYLRNAALFNQYFDLVAIADIKQDLVRDFGTRHHVLESGWYYSDTQLFDAKPDLDAVIITTLDKRHFYDAMESLKLGYHILLEKPIGVTEEECRIIEEEAEKHHTLFMICHELRYTPAFQKIKDLIRNGEIGDLMTIQAKEQIGFWHVSHSFVRGNCGNAEKSSPLFLQKCSHDMDILYWLSDSMPQKVSSFGSLTYFKPKNAPAGAPERCTDGCPAERDCPYSAIKRYLEPTIQGLRGWPFDMVVPVDMSEKNMEKALKEGPYGRCVFHCDNDVVDHQIVNIETENGTLISFTMSAFTSKNGRVLHIMGTKGEIWADIDDKKTIILQKFEQEPVVFEIDSLNQDGCSSSHGGGDDRLLEAWAKGIVSGNWDNSDITSLENSLPSHKICFAAEKSRLEGGKPIEL